MIASIKDLSLSIRGELQVTLTLDPGHVQEMAKLQDTKLEVTIKKYSAKRTQNANSLLWALCGDISRKLLQEASQSYASFKRVKEVYGFQKPPTDEEVYIDAVQSVGVYESLSIDETALEAFKERWGRNGIGWPVVVLDSAKGRKEVRAYYGSSVYSRSEMARLLDYLVDEAQQMGVVLPATKLQEIEAAKHRWGNG